MRDIKQIARQHLLDRDELLKQLIAATARADAYRDTLRSIAANGCCEGCQEARRVAISALEQTP
jgi:hypothetical protein